MISLIEQKDKEIIRLKKGSIQYSSISQEDNSIQETLRTEKAKWKQQMQSKLENELKRKYRIYEEKIEELSKALESKIDAHQNIDSKLLFVRISELEKEIEIRNLRIKECEMNLNRESILQDKLKEKDQICTTLLEKLNILEKENINLYDRIEYLEDESTHSSIPKHLQEENQILHSKIRELASRLNATDRDQDCDCSSDNLLIERIEELERILDVYEKKNFRGKLDSERRKLAKANSDIELLKHENESLVSELRFLKDEKLCFTVGKKKASPSLSLQIETRNLLGKVDDNSSSQKFDTFKVTKFSYFSLFLQN